VAVPCLAVSLLAQQSARDSGKAKTQLRALAVVEFPEKGKPRLVPVTILVDGQYYDAGIYKASPVPMSLDPGTVYEAKRAGEPQGLFVITDPAQLRRNWIASGNWKPENAQPSETKTTAPQPIGAAVDSDAPPVLRRGRPEGSPPEPPSPQQQSKNAPPQPAAGSNPAPSSSPGGQDDSDKPPVLRRPTGPAAASNPAPAQPPSASQTAQSAADQDPNRPRLRYNTEPTPSQVANSKGGLPSPVNASWKIKEAYPAISDTREDEHRDYRFDWRPDEKARMQDEAEAIATTALQKYAKDRARLDAGPLQDVKAEAFNLDFSNIPYVVLTATAQAARNAPDPNFHFYVTIIARPSPTQELRQVLAVVTDSSRLDVFPELQLVDAVDADGDGRAELLFADITDQGRSYRLYQMIGDNATELFTSVPIQNSSYRP
jgi:hypothetical protein